MTRPRALLAALLIAACGLPAMAQDTKATPQRLANGAKFGVWTVVCQAVAVGETACVLSQSMIRASDNKFLAEVLAFWSGDGAKSFLAARVPNGVYFPSGFAFKREASDERTDFIWQSCSRDLCEAVVEIDPATIAPLESDETLLAGYRPGMGQEPVVFRLNLAGLGEGMAALKSAMNR